MNDQYYGTNDPQDGPGTEPIPPADDAGDDWQETQAFAPYGSSSDGYGYEPDDEPAAGRTETVTTPVVTEPASGGRGALWWAVAGVVGVLLTVGVVWGALSLAGSGDDAEQASGQPGVSTSATASATDDEAGSVGEATADASDGTDAAPDAAAGEGAGGGQAGTPGAAAPPSSEAAGTAGELAPVGKYTITIEDFGLDATEWLVGAGLPEPKNGRYAMVMLRGTYTGTGPGTPRDDLVVGISAGGKEWLDNGCKPVALADVSLDSVASGEEFVGSVCIDMPADEVEAPVLFVQDKRSGTRTNYQF